MAGQTDVNLEIAWKALGSQSPGVDWAMIPIMQPGIFTASAARKFPADLEALVVDFPGVHLSETRRLPEGGGFEVVRLSAGEIERDHPAIALVRHPAGALEMFTVMATDILTLLDRSRDLPGSVLVNRFLERVIAWQMFMQPPRSGPLSLDAQTGLFGELWFLGRLLDKEMAGPLAVESWDGPMRGAQDYRLNDAAVEIKSSTAAEGFPAKIQSLEQLDETGLTALFLVALRLEIAAGGCSLPELVDQMRDRLTVTGGKTMFDRKLLAVGYHDDHVQHYDRCFFLSEYRIHRMNADFPRLFRGNIAHAVVRATYEIELDGIDSSLTDEAGLFQGIGLE